MQLLIDSEQQAVLSIARCYSHSSHPPVRSLHCSASPASALGLCHSLNVERGTLWKEGHRGQYYHMAHLSSSNGDGRYVSFLILVCECLPPAEATCSSSSNSACVRVTLRTANRLVLSPFLASGSVRHASTTVSTEVPTSPTAQHQQVRKKELYTERLLVVPLQPSTVRVVAVVVRASGGAPDGAPGSNLHKGQMGHVTPEGRVLPVAVTHRLVHDALSPPSSSSTTTFSSSKTYLPALYSVVTCDLRVKDLEGDAAEPRNKPGGETDGGKKEKVIIDLV